VLRDARVCLSGGFCASAERDVAVTVGAAVTIPAEDVTRLLAAAARTPS
jgi:hypothetical protein